MQVEVVTSPTITVQPLTSTATTAAAVSRVTSTLTPSDPYQAGDAIQILQVFADSSGTAVDPTTVKFRYLASAIGTATTLTYGVDAALHRSAAGTYYVSIDTNESAGYYAWRFYSTGTNQAVGCGTFYARPAGL